MVGKHTLFELNPFKYIESCFTAWNMVWLGRSSAWTWKERVFCCGLVVCFLSISWVILAYSIFQVFHILSDFLSSWFTIITRGELKSLDSNCKFFIYPCRCIDFYSCILKLLLNAFMFRIVTSSWWIDCFVIMKWHPLSLVIFFTHKFARY